MVGGCRRDLLAGTRSWLRDELAGTMYSFTPTASVQEASPFVGRSGGAIITPQASYVQAQLLLSVCPSVCLKQRCRDICLFETVLQGYPNVNPIQPIRNS